MPMDAPTMDVLRKQAIAMAMLWFTARDYDTQGGHAFFHIRARDLGLKESVLPGMKIAVRIDCEPDGPHGVLGVVHPATKAEHNRLMHDHAYRNCEFCGCFTNANVRACCERGRAADGVVASHNDQRQVREDSQGLGEPGRLSPIPPHLQRAQAEVAAWPPERLHDLRLQGSTDGVNPCDGGQKNG